MKTSKMTEPSISKKLQQSIVVYSALGILFISAIVASVSILPLYSRLKQDEEKNLQFALKTKALAIEEYLSRAKDISLQIAGRTKAREKLEQYNAEKTTIKEVANFSRGILTEALSQSQEIAGMIRLDQRDQAVVQLGELIPQTIWAVPANASKNVLINAPIYLNNQPYLVLGVPIINQQSKRVGTDIFLFKMASLKRIVQDYTGLGETGETALGVVRDNQVQLFSPLRENQSQETLSIPISSPLGAAIEKASRQQSGILYIDKSAGIPAVMAYGPIQNSEWGFVIKINQAELYDPLNRQVGMIASVILGLILLGTGGMVLLLRPLAGKAILYSDELERQSQEKSALLEEKTAALQIEIAQRQRIEEALQQMDELKASSRLSAEQATDAATEATQALTLAQKGTQAVEQTLKGMETQKETVEAISKQILHLSQQTYQIASISNLVSDLANQTNMLALNAAVEAVRAGEQGKGFAIVAKEIRQLADQSKTSASKIHALISDIQTAIQSTVITTDAGQRTVEKGEEIAQKTAIAITGMKDAIDKVVINNQQISLNAEQQAIAIYQVVNAINALKASRRNAEL